MSSRHDVRRHERSKSRSVEHSRGWKHKSHDRTRSHSPKSSKHMSPSRERRETKHKKTKKKKRRSSSSSSSSDSGEEELKLLQRLETERLRLKEDKKKQKEQLKANETPEEKRARRLREKQEKERKRRERMGWDNEYQCYTNQDNPFGDSALTNTFVWTKKLAKEGVKTVSRDELEALNRQKQLENKIELEKVKQRRLEREAERAAREAEAAGAARAREALQFHTWARQEDAFHLQQARLRSQIRIRDGRAKPIDLLAWYVSSEECVDALEMHEPYTYLNGLQTQDLEDLLEDIKVYKELENNANQAYWEDVQTIVLDELNKLRRLAAPDARRDGVHQAVADDVTQIFKGKTGAQLEALQTQIEQKISGRHDGVDVGYWESLLSQLKAHMSRARLRDRHQGNLRRKLQLLKQEQGVTLAKQEDAHRSQSPEEDRPAEPPAEASTSATAAADELPGLAPGAGAQAEGAGAQAEGAGGPGDAPEGEGESDSSAGAAEEDAASAALYRAGRYSPAPLSPSALEPATLLTEPAHDAQRLAYLRAGLRAAAAHSRTRGKVSTRRAAVSLSAGARHAADGARARRAAPRLPARRPARCRRAQPHTGQDGAAGRRQHGGAGARGAARDGRQQRRGTVQRGALAARPALSVGRQVPAQEAAILQQSAHRLRVEQVQPDALRHGQPAAQDRAGLQVQHLLPGSHRQERHARVLAESMSRKPRLRRATLSRRAALRGHRLQDREPRVGVLVQARLPLPLPQQHLPAVVPLQALPIPPLGATRTTSCHSTYIHQFLWMILRCNKEPFTQNALLITIDQNRWLTQTTYIVLKERQLALLVVRISNQ